MPDIAEISSAPSGTQKRADSDSSWITASTGDKLAFNAQVRNTQGNNYTVKLYAGACLEFDGSHTVSVSNRNGISLYCDSNGDWNEIDSDGNITCQAIGTAPGGGVSVINNVQSNLPPPPWPPKK